MNSSSLTQKLEHLGPGQHICFIYKSEHERQSCITSFIRHGLEQRQKVICIEDGQRQDAVIVDCLRDDNVDVVAYAKRGQLVILGADETYIQGGFFDPERMIDAFMLQIESALAEGYPAIRVAGQASWAARGYRGAERLIEYESKVNALLPWDKLIAICQYDIRLFSPGVLINVLHTHPFRIEGTSVHENLYYLQSSSPAKSY